MDPTLQTLAEQAGIALRYWDISGAEHVAPEATLRAILTAMGFDPDLPQAGLETLETRAAGLLAPVYVLYTADPKSVVLNLAANGNTKFRWSVALEDGGELSGESESDALVRGKTRYAGARSLAEFRLPLPELPMGHHRLTICPGAQCTSAPVIVSPGQGFLPEKARCTGLSAQLYALRGAEGSPAGRWGIGDFSTLKDLVRQVAAAGGDAVGLNPLHALFPDQPEEASPYCPASRLFKNPLYLDLPAPEGLPPPGAQVDYQTAAQKYRLLHQAFEAFSRNRASPEWSAFRKFVIAGGINLKRFAAYQAFSEKLGSHDWIHWPDSCQDPASGPAIALMAALEPEIEFYSWLQFRCEEQFAAAAAAAEGMAIGLYNDLAVSVNAASADCWSHQDIFARDLRIGAPPDPFNMAGQEWGVVPMLPGALRQSGYKYFIALLRANMHHAGALRIDHVMGWLRLFIIPAGGTPADGAYLSYPADDLFAIATLESRKSRCMLIGEDLGTVPDGFRERMEATRMLSCKVFWFERNDVTPSPPEGYAPLAAVSVATHDLPTLAGWFQRTDIVDKISAGVMGEADRAGAENMRDREVRALLSALKAAGLLPEGVDADNPRPKADTALTEAVYLYLAGAPSKLMLVQADDLAGQVHQCNMPGTTDSYPNWRHRVPGISAAWMASLAKIAAART